MSQTSELDLPPLGREYVTPSLIHRLRVYDTELGKQFSCKLTTLLDFFVSTYFGNNGLLTLIGGAKTVTDATVTAQTFIIPVVKTLGTVTVPQAMKVLVTAGVNFVITSADATDTSVVRYLRFELPS